MVDRGNSRMVEYQDGDVAIVSHEPLIGTVELASDGEEIVQLQLDKDTAEQLLSVLLEFLAKGEGEDAPNLTIHGQH